MNKIGNSDFVHLHVHTDKSMLDGIASVDELIQKAIQCEHRAIAITDHGNLHAVIDFAEKALSNNIKPIIGCEFYYQNDDNDRSSYHITVLAKDNEGLVNLYKLSTYSYLKGFYYKPRINKKILFDNSKGLIVTTGCLGSHINSLILSGKIEEAEKEFRDCLDIFGEDFYIEIHDHGLHKQVLVNKVLLSWAERYNVKVLASNDVHYLNREDAAIQDIILAVKDKTSIDDNNRFRILNDKGEFLDQLYYKSTEEMLKIPVFSERKEALLNTVEVAEKCNVSIKKGGSLYPSLYNNADALLRDKVYKSLAKKYGEITENIKQRIDYELSVIERLGYSSYFLIVSDIVSYAKESGILVGPGRGSAAGSMVAYALGITAIDPIKYGLIFERFLNPERISPPDIDIDFQHDKRDDVIKHIESKYGEDKVARLITFSTLQLRNAVRDVLRAFGVKPENIDRISKQIDNKKHGKEEIKLILKNAQVLDDANIDLVVRSVNRLMDKTRHTGIHPSGVVVSPCSLEDIVPLSVVSDEVSKTKIKVTQFDMRDVEKLGLLKIDILGLSTLTIIKNCIEKAGAELTIEQLYNLDTNEQEVYDIFSSGFTKGIFQFEGEGVTSYLMKLKPTCINDLIALNALYRPGPLQYIDSYINRKHGREKVTYLHPSLEDILKETYGIIIYQEQIMQIAQKLAGFSMAQADEFRRGIGKKETEKILKNKEKFIDGCLKNNIPKAVAEKIFEDILRFAEYGFNKSHAAAYAYLAYVTAYLKKKYPLQFYAALLNDYISDHDKLLDIIFEMKKRNLGFAHPDINESEEYFTIANNKVIAGLYAIKNVRTDSIQKIISERKRGGAFKTFSEFLNRIKSLAIDKKTYEALLFSGALNSLINNSEYSLNELAHPDNIDKVIEYISKKQGGKSQPNYQMNSLFDLDSFDSFIQRNQKINFINKKLKLGNKELIKNRAGFYALSIPDKICNEFLSRFKDKIPSKLSVFYCADVAERISKNKNLYYEYTLWGTDSIITAYGSQKINLTSVPCLVELEKNEDRYFIRNIFEYDLDNEEFVESVFLKYKNKTKQVASYITEKTEKENTTGNKPEEQEKQRKGCKYEDIDKIEDNDMRMVYILDRIILYEIYSDELKHEFHNNVEVCDELVMCLSVSRGIDTLRKYGYSKIEVLDEINSIMQYYINNNNPEVVRRLSTFKVYVEKYF